MYHKIRCDTLKRKFLVTKQGKPCGGCSTDKVRPPIPSISSAPKTKHQEHIGKERDKDVHFSQHPSFQLLYGECSPDPRTTKPASFLFFLLCWEGLFVFSSSISWFCNFWPNFQRYVAGYVERESLSKAFLDVERLLRDWQKRVSTRRDERHNTYVVLAACSLLFLSTSFFWWLTSHLDPLVEVKPFGVRVDFNSIRRF